MKLNDLRKYAIRSQVRIQIRLTDEQECIVDNHGIARVPGLTGPTAISLERELESAQMFRLTPTDSTAKSRSVTRQELGELLGDTTAVAVHDHDDE
jgi:hypothetical protein